MTNRFYLLPIEQVTLAGGGNSRGPKYLAWRDDPDPPGLDCRWAMMDYGLINAALVLADVTTEQHTTLAAYSDVAALPVNIDQNISAAAVPTVQTALEALRIPADWVTTSYTYRQILRGLAGLFQFAQRYHGMWDEQLIDSVAQLDVTWNQIPTARQDRIKATADNLGYSYSDVRNTWKVRRILMYLAQQWGVTPFVMGGVEF